MKGKLDILKWLLPLVVLLATACGHDDLVLPDEYQEEVADPYIELRIEIPFANPSSTRANPMGGEEGNGRERGILNEDKIHNINVFFYNDENYGGKGMDSDAGTPIIFQIYYNLDEPNDPSNSKLTATTEDEGDENFESQYIRLRFEYNKEVIPQAEGIKFLAIANVGDLTPNKINTLGALRDLDLTSSSFSSWISDDVFSKNAKNMDHFLMSTAYNTNNTFAGQLTGTNTLALVNGEYSGTTTLQRMYARLDLWYNSDVNAGSVTDPKENIYELVYPVNGVDGNNIFLTNVLAVNVKKTPSYVFKKVTANHTGTWNKNDFSSILSFSWGGKESPNDGPYTGSSYDDKPQNYVMEPSTLYKNKEGTVGDFQKADGTYGGLKDWYGNTAVKEIKTTIKDPTKGKFSDYYHMPRSRGSHDPDYKCDHISIISYANENTHPTDCFHRNYLTGMAFRGVYVPAVIYKAYNEVEDDGKTTTGLTSMTDADIADVNISGTTEVKIYRYSPTAGYSSTVDEPHTQLEKESKYFLSKNDAENYAKAHPEYMGIITEYDAIKHNVNNVTKLGFVCYYNLWLRHYNDENDVKTDPHPHLPMEYAIVRNNIYRVAVSFSGPGDPEPTMREPDTMKARIFVRKWNYRPEDEIIF